MTHWLYPANTKFYDVFSAFKQAETYWPINSKVEPRDIVIIYLAAPHKQIGFICEVLEIGIDMNNIIEKLRPFFKSPPDDSKQAKQFMKLKSSTRCGLSDDSPLSYSHLKKNGLNGMLMGPRKLENNPSLLKYIKGNI